MQNKASPILCAFFILVFIQIAAGKKNSTILYKEAVKIALKGDIDQAIIAFKKVIKVNPYYSLGHYGLGRSYLYKEGSTLDAVRHLKLSVEYDRRNAKGYFYLGIAYMFIKRYSDAVHAFEEAYKNDKDILEALYNIGVIYDIMNINHKATQYFEEYLDQKYKKEEDILF